MTTSALSSATIPLAPHVTSRARRRAGVVLTTLPALFLVFDGVMKLANVAPVREASARMGWPVPTMPVVGALLLACLAIHLVPRTAFLGAVLLTGYLGGAISAHVRLGDPLLSHTLFPVYLAVMIWGGLYLRDARARALAPWRRPDRELSGRPSGTSP
jgi:hypothetical protein